VSFQTGLPSEPVSTILCHSLNGHQFASVRPLSDISLFCSLPYDFYRLRFLPTKVQNNYEKEEKKQMFF
jgi:hypothetical protein